MLNAYLFDRPNEVQERFEQWRWHYNTKRPQKAPGYQRPIVSPEKMPAAESSQAANENDPNIKESRDAEKGKTTLLN
jgi:hypothetical protein